MKQKKPLLTISLLISNRPDTIPRCLDSLKLIMDKIPSELILIDTSKNEDIHKMLYQYTDKVYEFEWCQDFAKARNEGIRRAKGSWFMYLDDDEWLVDVDAILKFFQTGKYKKYECANIQVRNFLDPEYTVYTDNWITRLFYLGGGAKFEGKIHEYIYPIYGDPAFLQALINHSGYIYETEEKRRQHFERNSKLLLDVIKEEPTRLRWQGQLVQEYRSVKEWDAIAEFCQECLTKPIKINTFMDRNHFCTLYAGLAEALMNLRHFEEALAVCEQALKDERSMELLRALMHLREAECYVEFKNWDTAREQVEKYLEYYQTLSKDEAALSEQKGSLLVHATFEKEYVDAAYNILIYSELKKENLDNDEVEGEEQELKQIDAFSGIKFVRFMVKLMATMEYKDVFARFVTNACQNDTMCNWVCAVAQEWEKEDEAAFQKIAYAFSKADSDFWYICYCRVILADAKKKKGAVEQAIENLLKSLPNVFYLPDKIYDLIDKYKIKVALLWDKVAAEQWPEQISAFMATNSVEYINKISAFVTDVYHVEDWHVVALDLGIMERQIMEGPQMQAAEYYDLLKNYSELKLVFYHNFYNKKANSQEVPVEVQAAAKIKAYIDLEAQDKRQALSKLKEVVDICPAFAKGISGFFHLYSQLEAHRVEKQKAEMQALRNQVMAQVHMMIASGQSQAALQIVGQLKQMFPEDLEVVQLALEVRLKTLE